MHNRYRQAGGEDEVVRVERELLGAAGHEVIAHEVENPVSPVESAATLAAAAWNPRQARRLQKLILETRPDVVHVHNTWFTLSPAVIITARRAGVPIVATLHNFRLACVAATLYRDGGVCTDCLGGRGRGRSWPGVVHRCYRDSVVASGLAAGTQSLHRLRRTYERDVDRFVAPSHFVASVMGASRLPAERITVVPNPVLDPGVREEPPSRSDRVLYVGRLVTEKGIIAFARTWARHAPGALRLSIVGDGPARDELAGLRGVELLGQVPRHDVDRLMLTSRALAFPSLGPEPFGLVAVEAMAAGLPVLGSDRGAIPELIGDPAWVVDPDGASAWIPEIARLDLDDVVDGAGRANRQRYVSAFTDGVALRRLERVYREVSISSANRSSQREAAGDAEPDPG